MGRAPTYAKSEAYCRSDQALGFINSNEHRGGHHGGDRNRSEIDNRRRNFLLGGSALQVLAMMEGGAASQIAQARQQQPEATPGDRGPITG